MAARSSGCLGHGKEPDALTSASRFQHAGAFQRQFRVPLPKDLSTADARLSKRRPRAHLIGNGERFDDGLLQWCRSASQAGSAECRRLQGSTGVICDPLGMEPTFEVLDSNGFARSVDRAE
jgi:hypothetical protein